MLKGFKQFILRGNVIELSVAVVMGAAFGAAYTYAKDAAGEIIYFVEDDYLHAPSALPEMLEAQEPVLEPHILHARPEMRRDGPGDRVAQHQQRRGKIMVGPDGWGERCGMEPRTPPPEPLIKIAETAETPSASRFDDFGDFDEPSGRGGGVPRSPRDTGVAGGTMFRTRPRVATGQRRVATGAAHSDPARCIATRRRSANNTRVVA